MPIMASTTYHKYDVVDYYSVDEEYGTVDDFTNLLDECHKRDIRVIIDFELNHSSSENKWFTDACRYLASLDVEEIPDPTECQYVEYYNFSDEQVNGSYYNVPGTEWYYEGVFWSEMPDLNLHSELVREEMEKVAEYWIELGVDGFRMDAAMHFKENDTEFNDEVLNWFYNYCCSINPDFYMVSEVWASEATIADYYASKTPSIFNFDLADTDGKIIKAAAGRYSASKYADALIKYENDFSEEYAYYIDAPFIKNHDMARVANALMNDENDMKMSAGLLLTTSGSPFVYYGEEIGMASYGTKDENKRLPMIWSVTDETGITAGPADADDNIISSFASVEEQLNDNNSILNYYKRGLRLRNENPEIARGKITKIDKLCDDDVAVINKTYEDNTITIIYNLSDEKREIDLSQSKEIGTEIRGYLTLNNEIITLEGGILNMPEQSICILK